MISAFLRSLGFHCRHRKISRVFFDKPTGQNYIICMDCCRRYVYDWRAMQVLQPLAEPVTHCPVEEARELATLCLVCVVISDAEQEGIGNMLNKTLQFMNDPVHGRIVYTKRSPGVIELGAFSLNDEGLLEKLLELLKDLMLSECPPGGQKENQ